MNFKISNPISLFKSDFLCFTLTLFNPPTKPQQTCSILQELGWCRKWLRYFSNIAFFGLLGQKIYKIILTQNNGISIDNIGWTITTILLFVLLQDQATQVMDDKK